MSIHEAFDRQHDEQEQIEAALLRSDLMELFQTHGQAQNTAIFIPDDFEQPADVILSGTYQASETEQAAVTIIQRTDEAGLSYLLMRRVGDENYQCLITNTTANSVWTGMPAMTYEDLTTIRIPLQPGATDWSAERSQQAADDRVTSDPFSYVRYYSGSSSQA